MRSGHVTTIIIPSLKEFNFQIKYTETNRASHTNEIDLHTHDAFEIYINLSGDISFLVESNLYNLSRGDVIIARPGEHHHCVYRSDATHKLYWILFECHQNSSVFDFLKEGSCDNYFSPTGELREELLELCQNLHSVNLTNEEKIYSLFRMLAILKKSKKSPGEAQPVFTQEFHQIIHYINQHIHEKIKVSTIAKEFYISQSTLERKFKEYLGATSLEYIKSRKMILSAKMLRDGESVFNAGQNVGYQDNSYFIEVFKQHYGITPSQYRSKYRTCAK